MCNIGEMFNKCGWDNQPLTCQEKVAQRHLQVFLNIEKSKTSFRGKAVVQHTRVSDELTISVAEKSVRSSAAWRTAVSCCAEHVSEAMGYSELRYKLWNM